MDRGRGSFVRKASVEKIEGIRNNVENGTVPVIIDKRDYLSRISQLPDDVIMLIFSFLTPRDIVVTRALGKMWARISPVFKLNHKHFIENKAVELFESYKNQGVRVKTCSLDIPYPFKYSTCIDDWLQLVANNDIYIMHICFGYNRPLFPFTFKTAVSLSKDLVVLSMQNCSLKGLSYNQTWRLDSLQELFLNNVELSKDCDSLISAFYNIRKLQLKYCLDFHHLCFSHLHRLEEVEIWCGRSKVNMWIPLTGAIILNNSSVKNFVFHENCSNPRTLSFQGCKNLETVWLDAIFLPDLSNEILLPENCYSDEFPRLKKLFLHGSHQRKKKFTIDRSSLEVLQLSYVAGIEGAIINTPRLHTFKYAGKSFEPFLLTMNTGTRLHKISLEFHESCPIDATWFLNLRLFVRNLSQDGVLSLRITNVVLLSSKSLKNFRSSLVWKLKLLKVKDLPNLSPSSFKDLIIGLLWGFHPKTLTVILAKEPTKYIEVVQKHLQNKKGETKCYNSSPSQCWRHGLKCAEIELSSRVGKKRPYKDLVELNINFQWED